MPTKAHKAAGARLCRALALVCAALLFCGQAWAATWHVDMSGTGAGAADGSSYANRFAGWADAEANTGDIDAGDTVCLYGTQSGTESQAEGGSSGNFLTLDGRCDNTADPGIVEAGGTTCWTSVQSRTDLIIQNMTFRGFTGTCLDMRSSTRSKLLNNIFVGTNNGGDTAVILGPSSNEFRGNRCDRVSSCFATRGYVNGIVDSNRIEYGGAYGTGSTANLDGIAIDDASGVTGCEGAVVSNNVVLYQGASQGSGIDFQCTAGTGEIVAYGNVVMYGEGVGITVGSLSTLSHDISSSVSAYNALNQWYQKTTNTAATYTNIVGVANSGSAQSAFRFGDGSSATMTATITNSVFVADQQTLSLTSTSGTITDDHNVYYGPLHTTADGARTLAQWVSAGQCAGGGCLAVDPQFAGGVRPSSVGGFSPAAGSPMVGGGDSCASSDVFGDAYYSQCDIGAARRDQCYRRGRDGVKSPARTRAQIVERCRGIPGRYPEGL